MPLASIVLALVTLQRLGELLLSYRNTRALRARGAFEVGAGHYPFVVLLHGAWLAGLWLLAWDRPVALPLLASFIALQVMRVWVLASLKERWTTRVIVLPGEPLVRRGPYRLLRHPNYLVVIGEIALLPAAFGLWSFAIIFSLANAILLMHRIRVENQTFSSSQEDHKAVRPD